MNISRLEQRVLHVLAQGGYIRHERGEGRKITEITCFNRDGFVLTDCTMKVFSRLRGRRLIQSRNSGPYRITRLGRRSVRSQPDNR